MWRVWAVILSVAVAGPAEKCRALALAGGGDKGAYQAGVVAGLVSALPPGEAEYDVVTGVGCGALNAVLLATYALGTEASAASALTSFWEASTSSHFYQDWTRGLIEGILRKSGLYDSAPLLNTIEKATGTGTFHRQVVVGSTDLISGDFVTFDNYLSLSDLQKGVAGSFSMAGVFPVVSLDDLILMDGTIKFAVDILSAVTHCQDSGYSNFNIIVDIAMVSGATVTPINAANYKTLQVLVRLKEIFAYDAVMQVVNNAAKDFPGVTLRHVISPSGSMPDHHNPWPYDFSSSSLKEMINMGFSDAAKAVQATLVIQ